MNFYGSKVGPEHKLFGRIALICEAAYRSVLPSEQQPKFSNQLPQWCHNIIEKLDRTILKGLIELNPEGKFTPRGYGRIVGLLLRAGVFFSNEVPAQLKEEGLLNLNPEQESQIEQLVDLSALLAFAGSFLKVQSATEDEISNAAIEAAKKKAESTIANFIMVIRYLLKRPVSEQHEFLSGIPEGFVIFMGNDGEFTGQRKRTELYLLLLCMWPEITEMQKSQPPKTCAFLLDWLEKGEGRQLVTDEKQFLALCGEIGLVMALPGHPHNDPIG